MKILGSAPVRQQIIKNIWKTSQRVPHPVSLVLVKQTQQLIFIGWIMLSNVIKLCCKQPAAEKLCWKKHLGTGRKPRGNVQDHWGQTERDPVLLPAPSRFKAGVQLLWQFSSCILPHQREIRVNSPFTFAYEETPLHCLLRPLPPPKSRHRSGRKQGQERGHVCERAKHATTWLPLGPAGQSRCVNGL